MAALRAKTAEMLAGGATLPQVASALGVTTRRARRFKDDVAAIVKASSASTIDGIVEGGNRARAVIVDNSEAMAQTLVDAARGVLAVGDTPAMRAAMAERGVEDLPSETDPQMINARTKAAATALQFILATKIDANIKSDMTPETAAAVVAIAKAKAGA